MDWENYIERWSRVPARLEQLQRFCMKNKTLPHSHTATASFFLVVADGEATVGLAHHLHDLRPFHILHGGKDGELAFHSASDDFTCYFIAYAAESESPEDEASFRMSFSFAPQAALPLIEKCRIMYRLWEQADALDRLQAQSAFLSFVYEVMLQLRSSSIENKRTDIVTEAIRYIHDHYRETTTVEELSRSFNCSASYLSRLFKNQIGLGPNEYLIHVRIQKAKGLLLKSEARIHDVASSVGYADVYYFSRLFKKHTGLSPLQYREKHKKMVQDNPFPLYKSSIVSLKSDSYNENESYFQSILEGDISMFRFIRPNFASMMLICTALILSACQAGNSAAPSATTPPSENPVIDGDTAKTRIYEHLNGKTEIPTKPQRVVSFFHVGQLIALGVKPVGTTTFQLNNPLIEDKTGITDVGTTPDMEVILTLQPDLIVTTAPFAEIVDGGYEALSLIAPTIVVPQHDDPLVDIAMFGDILGLQEKAEQWTEAFSEKIAASKEKVSAHVGAEETFTILNLRPGAFFMYGDTNMGGNILFKYLGLTPQEKVLSDVINGETWDVSIEVIPDYIGDRLFLAVNEGTDREFKDVENLIQHTPAWQSGNVYSIEFNKFLFSDPVSVEKQLDIIVELLTENKS